MKKLLLLIAICGMFVMSCSTLKEIQPLEYETSMDVSRFSEKGFLITSQVYNGQYLLIMTYGVYYFPSAHKITEKIGNNAEYGTSSTMDARYWKTDEIDYDSLLNKIYDISIKKGGDAFVNLRFEDIVSAHIEGGPLGPRKGIEISGWIIKRIDKNIIK